MKAWRRVDPREYRALDLHAHALLAGVPLHDVWELTLPGGGAGRTVADLRSLMSLEEVAASSRPVRWLFQLRALLGRVFGWDREEPARAAAVSATIERLPDALRTRSDPAPGTPDPPFVLVYALPDEVVSEIRNATVHAFSVLALNPTEDGYRAHWAIHVEEVGAITRFYMALIDPFRRLVVYPTLLRHVSRRWAERGPS